MPWHIEQDKAGCNGFAVVKDADGSTAGCHPSRAAAEDQIAALYANEPQMEAAAMQPDFPPMDDPQVLQDEFAVEGAGDLENPDAPPGDSAQLFDVPTDLTDVTPCWGVACIEGIPDGGDPPRVFEPGSLTFAPLPWSLKWQREEEHGHDGSVVVGRVDAAWRDGALIRWTGVLDNGSEDGREAQRLVGQQFVRGVSIKADDCRDTDIEKIYAPLMDPTEIPEIDGEPMPMDEMPAGAPPVAGSAEDGEGTEDFHLPGQHNQADHGYGKYGKGRASQRQKDAASRRIKARKAAGQFLQRPDASAQNALTADGEIGLDLGGLIEPEIEMEIYHQGRIRSLTIVAEPAYVEATISLGESPFTPIDAPTESPLADLEAMAQADDAAAVQEIAPMTAAGYTITLPQVPPEEWFAEPSETELAALTAGAVNITADGRVYGLLAPASVDHRAFRPEGRSVIAPRGIDYSEWQNKACIVAGADGMAYKINAGTVTFDCGHASPVDPRRRDPNWAAQHYDNSCSVAMRARVGENRFGTWFAGSLVRGLTASSLERIMGCALSGDWQGGKLKAALLVPCEGFPQAVRASTREKMGVLVASSVPIHFEARLDPLEPVWALIASVSGRGPDARFAELAAERFAEISEGG